MNGSVWNHVMCQARGPILKKHFTIDHLWDQAVYCPYCGVEIGGPLDGVKA